MKIKKVMHTSLALLLSATFMLGVTACNNPSSSSSDSENSSSGIVGGTDVKASLKFAAAEDKILQSYSGDTMSELKKRFMDTLTEDCSIVAFKNEYETKQLIITPETDVDSYFVSVGDFVCGQNTISAAAFDVRHMYYHEVATIFDSQSTMQPGMYPDALLPMETAAAYGRNKIKAGENQGVYITVKVPKDVPAGVYSGKITVTLDGNSTTIAASITVLDYTLPDTVSMKSCIPTQPGYLFAGELDDTQEMYDKVTESLKEFRLSNQYLESYYIASTSDPDYTAFVLDLATDKAVEAAKDPAASSYAIKCYETADTVSGKNFGYVLNTELLETSLKAYVDKSIEEKVNLFEKAYVYMGNIIDEPDLGGQTAWDRANFVCKQYAQTVEKAVAYAQSAGAAKDVIEDLANLQNVVTGAYSSHLPEVTSYCPTIDIYESSAARDDYAELRENGKDYWWYTCTVPKIPYPTVHIDDNGVSARVMSWMAYDYDVTGYLTWESVYYKDAQEPDSNGNPSNVYGIECYDDVWRWGDTFGDGFFFYPGKVFGLDAPVPSMRLYNMRDGLEDYEAMHDLESIYAELSAQYGAVLSAEGVLSELYALLYDDVKVYSSSADIAKAKALLGELVVLAKQGIAVSDFSTLANGKISAKVYAPKGVNVTVTGGVKKEASACNVYTVETALETFGVLYNGTEFSLSTASKTLSDPTNTERVTVYDSKQNDITATAEKSVNGDRLQVAMPKNARSLRYRLDDGFVTSKTNGMQIYVYSSASEKIEVSVSLFNGTMMTSIDTVYIYPGENVIRFDRLYDNNWSKLKKATHVIFGFETKNDWTLSFENVVVR